MKKIKKDQPYFGAAEKLFTRLEDEVADMQSRTVNLAISVPGLPDIRDNAVRIGHLVTLLRKELVKRKALKP